MFSSSNLALVMACIHYMCLMRCIGGYILSSAMGLASRAPLDLLRRVALVTCRLHVVFWAGYTKLSVLTAAAYHSPDIAGGWAVPRPWLKNHLVGVSQRSSCSASSFLLVRFTLLGGAVDWRLITFVGLQDSWPEVIVNGVARSSPCPGLGFNKYLRSMILVFIAWWVAVRTWGAQVWT